MGCALGSPNVSYSISIPFALARDISIMLLIGGDQIARRSIRGRSTLHLGQRQRVSGRVGLGAGGRGDPVQAARPRGVQGASWRLAGDARRLVRCQRTRAPADGEVD